MIYMLWGVGWNGIIINDIFALKDMIYYGYFEDLGMHIFGWMVYFKLWGGGNN